MQINQRVLPLLGDRFASTVDSRPVNWMIFLLSFFSDQSISFLNNFFSLLPGKWSLLIVCFHISLALFHPLTITKFHKRSYPTWFVHLLSCHVFTSTRWRCMIASHPLYKTRFKTLLEFRKVHLNYRLFYRKISYEVGLL